MWGETPLAGERGHDAVEGGLIVDADVVVVGAGPVGLTLAAELRAWGISTVVLERRTAPDDRLRAPAITERTIEALERHGLLDRLARESSDVKRVDGTRMMPIRQDLVERILDDHVRTRGADVRRGHEVVQLTSGNDGVALQVRRGDGVVSTLTAGWVVGCDGGHSTVRAAAGIAFPGTDPTLTGYQAEVTIADPGKLRRGWHRTPTGVAAYELGPAAGAADPGLDAVDASGPTRVVSLEFTGPPPDRTAPVTLDEVQASLRRTSGTDVTLTAARSLTRFSDNARIAETYRKGRVLLAGDAAHVHAPFGGQGLNLGIQDATNLGWKLAGTVRGWAPPRLLDSYDEERRPVAAQVLQTVRAAVTLLDPDPRMTAAYELFAELRQLDAVKRHLHEKTAMVNLRYPVGQPGEAAHPLLGRAPRDLNVMRAGRGLLLVLAGAGRVAACDAVGWSDRIDIVEADGVTAASLDGDVAALLLRPDGFVGWVGDRDGWGQPGSVRDTLMRWYGQPALARVSV